MRELLFVLLAVAVFGCSSSNDFENGKHQLESMGYTDVESTGHEFFCCGNDDSFSTGFTCKDKDGNTVTGCFCSAILKGVTIRFE